MPISTQVFFNPLNFMPERRKWPSPDLIADILRSGDDKTPVRFKELENTGEFKSDDCIRSWIAYYGEYSFLQHQVPELDPDDPQETRKRAEWEIAGVRSQVYELEATIKDHMTEIRALLAAKQ